nr:hypothetical protein [Treponema sp.]
TKTCSYHANKELGEALILERMKTERILSGYSFNFDDDEELTLDLSFLTDPSKLDDKEEESTDNEIKIISGDSYTNDSGEELDEDFGNSLLD